MAYQVIFAYDKPCEKELIKMGFTKETVYMKHTFKGKKEGDSEIFNMKDRPFQFCTTDFWGAGPSG
jgi:hypothetical protein